MLALAAALLGTFPLATLAQTESTSAPKPAPAAPEQSGEPSLPSPPVSAEGQDDKAPPPDAPAPPLEGPSLLLNPTVGQALLHTDYRAIWLPSEQVAGQPTRLGDVQQDFSVSFPLWQNGTNEWSAALHVRSELFQTHALLPDTRQPFPEELWNIRLSSTYRHLFDNGWIGGGSVSVGSASDRPFASIDEMTVGINAFLRVSQGEHNAWLFTLAYSSNSQLPIPIPGVAYVYQPSECLRVNLGLPFQLMYRPCADLTLDLSYMLLTTVHARATYRVCGPLRLYVGYDWNNESYLRADRPDVNDRFFSYDQRVTGGVQYPFSKHALLDLSGGYVFDRFYFEGRQLSDSHHNRIDVGDGPFLSLRCQFRW